MSLVITSNQYLENSGDYNSAFSYRNALTGTTMIPADSEIACASLKINKNGTITINKSMVFAQYFNQELVDGTLNLEQTTGIAHEVQPFFSPTDDNVLELTPTQLAERLKIGINNALFHPELSADVSVNTDSNGFKGFRVVYTQSNASAGDVSGSLVASDFVNIYEAIHPTAGMTWNSASKTLSAKVFGGTTTPKRYNVAILQKHISLINGSLDVNLSQVNSANWTIGLCRSDPDASYVPSYYATGLPSVGTRSWDFYDFKICAEQDSVAGNRRIRVYHSVAGTDPTTGDPVLRQIEMPYYNIAGNPFFSAGGDAYDWSTNASAITDCKFNIANERVEISLFAGATEYKIVEYDGTNTNKEQNFKPICESCRLLYPKFHIDSSQNNKRFTLNSARVQGVVSNYALTTKDWFANRVFEGLDAECLEVDSRFYNDMTDTTIYINKALTANILTGYTNRLILDDSALYQVDYANFSLILGFFNQSVISPTSTSGTAINIFDSVDVPSMKSNTSIFVRLNNMGFNSINAGKGNLSKILYSIPRFSQDGSSVGSGLYFEPHERIYLPLNNPNDLVINEFWVDFVNENETLATDLTGKSVAIFHIRKRTK